MNHIDTMKLALAALEVATTPLANDRQEVLRAQAALREALAEKPAQGCEYCNHPLYAGTKCKNCGRVTEQPAKQDIPDLIAGALGVSRGTAYDLMREAIAKQPAQDQRPFCYHDGRNIVGKEFAHHSDVFPLYTEPQPAQTDWEAVAADQAMTIALLRAEQPAQGCNYCNHALYAGTKCKNCGRVTEQAAIKRDLTPEQPAQQEPLSDAEISAWAERHDINGTPLSLRCMVEDAASLHLTTTPQAQPAQQEPVEDRQERRVEAHNNVYATGVTVDRLHFLARQGLHSEGDTVGWYEAYFAIDRLLELAEQPAQQEPVARSKAYDMIARFLQNSLNSDEDYAEYSKSPDIIYTSPPAQRKPLTSTWIWWWLRKWCDSHPSLRQETYNSLFKMVKDAEAIEAAHGIKENTQLSKPLLEPDYYVYNIDGQYRLADPQPTIKWGNKC